MARNETTIDLPVEAVWAVLADADTYDDFVVGTKRIRGHDANWPDPGSALHHTVGVGPLAIKDRSRVVECEPPRLLRLIAGVRPVGEAEVVFTLEPLGPASTRVVIEEHPVKGPMKTVWNPVLDKLTNGRNAELLRRLSNVVEERARTAIANAAAQ
jgi:uncharacterized protein YndB with AHSA1/START domain